MTDQEKLLRIKSLLEDLLFTSVNLTERQIDDIKQIMDIIKE